MRPELQEIVDEVSRLLRRPATLEDRDFNLVAFNAHGAEIDEVRRQSILQRRSTAEVRQWFEQFGIATTDHPVRTPSSPDHTVLARLCLPARWRSVTYGYLWLLDEHHDLDDAAIPAALALAGRAGALMAQQARAREDHAWKLDDLLSADRDTVEQAAREIDELGIIRRGVPVVAVELHLATSRAAQPAPMNLWSLPRSVLASPGDQHTTLLMPAAAGIPGRAPAGVGAAVEPDLGPVKELAHRAWELYAERLDPAVRVDLVAGIGAPRGDLAQARESWREARLATRVSHAVPTLRPVASWTELGIYRLLACGPETALAGAILDPAVLRLLDLADSDLHATAIAYLDHGGSVGRTAAALHVHRQTVYYRLQRIEEITRLDLSRGDQRLVLHLGLTMAPLLAPSDLRLSPAADRPRLSSAASEP